jgi:hypothetical protein
MYMAPWGGCLGEGAIFCVGGCGTGTDVEPRNKRRMTYYYTIYLFYFFRHYIHTQAGSSETTSRIDIKHCHQSCLVGAVVDNLKILVLRVPLFRCYDSNPYNIRIEYNDD